MQPSDFFQSPVKLNRYSGKGEVMSEEIKPIQATPVVLDENGILWPPDLPSLKK
jgi:hypothetical protein